MTTPQKYLSPMSQAPERWPVLLKREVGGFYFCQGQAQFNSILLHNSFKGWQYIDVLPEEPVKTQQDIDLDAFERWFEACSPVTFSEAWCSALKWERQRGMPAPKPALDEAAIRADERSKFKARIMKMWEYHSNGFTMKTYASDLAADERNTGAGFLRALLAELKEEGK